MREISNQKLKLLRKLNQKKYRQQEALFIVEGGRAVQQVIKNDILRVAGLYFDKSQRYWEQNQWAKVADENNAFTVSEADFTEVSDTENPQGVLAVCEIPSEISTDELAGQEGIIVAVDRIQDPGNLGTIIRTSGWFGARGLLAGKGTVDIFHPKVVRSTAGATGTIPYRNIILNRELQNFEEMGWKIVLLDDGDHAVPLNNITPGSKIVIVVGNEANGVDRSLFTNNRTTAKISSPASQPNVESLNAAIALSVALYALSG